MAADGGRSNEVQQVFAEAVSQPFDLATISVCLASAKDKSTQPDLQSLEVTRTLADRFREIIRTFCRRQQQDHRTVHEYSIHENPSEYSIQYVDLANYPKAENKVADLLSPGTLVPFRNEERFVKNLRFYAIVAQFENGQTVVGLRSLTPAQKPDRGRWSLGAILHGDRYEELTTDLLLFDQEIDCLLYSNFAFIHNKDKFERIFNFYQILRDVAERALSTLRQELRIHNFEEFQKACLRDPRKQTRLAFIANRPDLSQFTITRAREVIAVNPQLDGIIRIEGGEEILAYDTKNPWTLIRFLSETTVSHLLRETILRQSRSGHFSRSCPN